METKYSKNTFCVIRTILSPLMKGAFRPVIEGKENIPDTGPYILAGNHTSILDIPLVTIASKKEIHFIAKEELFKSKIGSYILKKLGAISIKRDQVDLNTIKKSLEVLQNNEIIGIFPEGTRYKGEEIGEFKTGTSMLSFKSSSPIIPFGISGEYKLGKKINIRFGEAINFNREELKNGFADKVLQSKVKQLIKKN